jgi:hypothetical protein
VALHARHAVGAINPHRADAGGAAERTTLECDFHGPIERLAETTSTMAMAISGWEGLDDSHYLLMRTTSAGSRGRRSSSAVHKSWE